MCYSALVSYTAIYMYVNVYTGVYVCMYVCRYGDRKEALRGLVSSALITRHVLFIGFSLTDDNLHSIFDQVRKVLQTARRAGLYHNISLSLSLSRVSYLGISLSLLFHLSYLLIT